MNWYDENIEKGIRKEVKLLRDNGFNTICSCEHEKYIQCDLIMDGEFKRLHDLLFNNGYRNYKIEISNNVIDGHSYIVLEIIFKENKNEQWIKVKW